MDKAQGTTFQELTNGSGNGGDESIAGELHLFNPASTTYVKHFIARFNSYASNSSIKLTYPAGYINDATAIDDVRFKMSSGAFDGKIKMWGVK